MNAFQYPVGVLLFNRPHLSRHVLESLKRSTLPLSEKLVVFHIDGFSGSKNEENFESDQTNKTLRLVRKYFPSSKIIAQESNVGIAQSFYNVMSEIFVSFSSEFAVFQEEDVFLKKDYFKNLQYFLDEVSSIDEIGAVSVNDIDHYQVKREEAICPTFGTREFAIRREAFVESQYIFEIYLKSLGSKYRSKDLEKINHALRTYNIELPSPFQDVFQHEMLRLQRRLHVRWNIPGRYDANFTNGESIAGLSVMQILNLLLRSTRDHKSQPSDINTHFGDIKKELNQLSVLEDKYWNSRVFLSENETLNSRQSDLIRLRNRLKVTWLHNMLESLYLRKVLKE